MSEPQTSTEAVADIAKLATEPAPKADKPKRATRRANAIADTDSDDELTFDELVESLSEAHERIARLEQMLGVKHEKKGAE